MTLKVSRIHNKSKEEKNIKVHLRKVESQFNIQSKLHLKIKKKELIHLN